MKTPARRAASKPLLSAAKGWTADKILDVADALMNEPEREFAQVAVDLIRAQFALMVRAKRPASRDSPNAKR